MKPIRFKYPTARDLPFYTRMKVSLRREVEMQWVEDWGRYVSVMECPRILHSFPDIFSGIRSLIRSEIKIGVLYVTWR